MFLLPAKKSIKVEAVVIDNGLAIIIRIVYDGAVVFKFQKNDKHESMLFRLDLLSLRNVEALCTKENYGCMLTVYNFSVLIFVINLLTVNFKN